MTVHNKKYIFSGHESFPCKTLWLKKGYDFVVQGKDFNNPNSVIDLGVGKNMVASIRFWLRAFNVCKEGKPTWLGDYLFEEVYGKDRYIEDLATLWFFDKAKRLENKNRVLFIDARNYFTVVDRTLNEWSEWQLKNLQAIVHLYRGEQDKYRQLIAEYDAALEGFTITEAEAQLDAAKQIAKDAIANAQRKEKKQVEREMAEMIANCEDRLETARQREWLTSKFGTEGEYQDVLGLCKIATIDEISEKNYSLTPGAYVGVAEVEDDGVDFHERMNEIHTELASLNKEANELMSEIMKEWETLNTK